eukprot:9490263-Pyramimonas_sp.AAC.1
MLPTDASSECRRREPGTSKDARGCAEAHGQHIVVRPPVDAPAVLRTRSWKGFCLFSAVAIMAARERL